MSVYKEKMLTVKNFVCWPAHSMKKIFTKYMSKIIYFCLHKCSARAHIVWETMVLRRPERSVECSDSEKKMSACADQNHAPNLTCVRLELLPGIRRLINLLTILKGRRLPCISRTSAIQRILRHLRNRRIELLSRNSILL